MARVEDAFISIERLNQRFDEAYDRVEVLSTSIEEQARSGADLTILTAKLEEAEGEKKAILEALRMARHRKSVPLSDLVSRSTS
jgi:hypothetical protein